MLTKNKALVLLATYNGELWLSEQISSILSQKGVDVTAYISIDLSTDNTEFLCYQLAQQDPRITILPNVGKFGSAALNFFRLLRDVNFSDFDYIAFADQDDIWHSDKLSRAIEMLNLHQCDGYSSNVIAFWADGKQKLVDKAQSQVAWDFLFESAGPGCTFVFRKRLALDLQAFISVNEDSMSLVWLHDWFTYALARSRGYKWFIDKRPSMLYRQHGNNQVGVNTGYRAFLHRVRFVLSGKAMKQSLLLSKLFDLESNSFVKKWRNHSRLGMLYLMTQAHKCRRKNSEKLIFAFSCLALAIVGKKH